MEKKVKIMLVEDDPNLAFVIKDNLLESGYKVDHYDNGEDAENAFMERQYDLFLLDVMLPKKDGFSLAESIRSRDHKTPIIFLTAKEQQEDKNFGFKVGGDDYITKPFDFDELLLRISAVLKRTLSTTGGGSLAKIGNYVLNAADLTLDLNGQLSKLTKKEVALLQFMNQHVNQTIKREDILIKIWGDDDYFAGRSMDVFITKLRKYLKDDPRIEIANIHGVGFKLLVKEA
jgi:DNA-binding response OmpR family regulator